jgi:hypothetical protein
MARLALVLAAVAALVGCTTATPRDRYGAGAEQRAGADVTAILGTPFFMVGKLATCIVTTVVAVPSSAALALTDRRARRDERAALHEGMGHNCGGSWVLGPG